MTPIFFHGKPISPRKRRRYASALELVTDYAERNGWHITEGQADMLVWECTTFPMGGRDAIEFEVEQFFTTALPLARSIMRLNGEDVPVGDEIHIHINLTDDRVGEVLDRLRSLTHQGEHIMADLSALQAEVEENGDVVDSAVTLLNRLADELEQASGDQEAIDAIVAQIRSDSAGLADAVAANTPAAPGGGTDTPPGDIDVDADPDAAAGGGTGEPNVPVG